MHGYTIATLGTRTVDWQSTTVDARIKLKRRSPKLYQMPSTRAT